MSIFADVKVAPPDPILVTAQLFNQDTHPQKVNLGIGAYRTEKGVPWVLPSIKAAEMIIAQDPKAIKEYLAIDGLPELKKAAQELVFTPATLASGRVASCQALSGTGALRVAGEFFNSQLGVKKLYHSDPTWGNHTAIFGKCNMKVETYPYYKPSTRGFDFEGMIGGIKQMEPGSVILLHACATTRPASIRPTSSGPRSLRRSRRRSSFRSWITRTRGMHPVTLTRTTSRRSSLSRAGLSSC
jgi:aspartate/tyrosine/aromatic aminotransferase